VEFSVARGAAAQAAAPSLNRQQELLRLLRRDCGACHGLYLSGGLGPALTPAALRNKAVDSLVEIILAGRPNSPMPPWRAFLTETEAHWLVEQMRAGAVDAR